MRAGVTPAPNFSFITFRPVQRADAKTDASGLRSDGRRPVVGLVLSAAVREASRDVIPTGRSAVVAPSGWRCCRYGPRRSEDPGYLWRG